MHTEIEDPVTSRRDVPVPSGGARIEALHGIDHAREVETLQTAIWGASEGWIVPSHVLLIVAEYGGILLGARLDGTLVGFVLGFLARTDGALFHASHMLGVLPACRQHGIGAALKWHQRALARQQGLELMRWTFDPLEARNAYLNHHKLGTTCREYRPDYYGPMRDALNRDMPSDRLIVEWDLGGTQPKRAPVAAPDHYILRDRDGRPHLQLDAIAGNRPVAIEIPRDVQEMKLATPELALSWRLAVRQAFTAAFTQGYETRDFRDGAYLLQRREESDDAH